MSASAKLQVSKSTIERLNALATKLNPHSQRPGAMPLADKLLNEALDAIETQGEPAFPTIHQCRERVGHATARASETLDDRVAALEQTLERYSAALKHAEAERKGRPPKKRAA